MIGRSGERKSGISVLGARHDDDDDVFYRYKLRKSLKLSRNGKSIRNHFNSLQKTESYETIILWFLFV